MNVAPRVLGFLALLSLTSALNAALMVDWGGNYVSSNAPFSNPDNGATPPVAVTQYGGFSGGSPLLLSPSNGYSGTSSIFYGQIIRTSGTATFTSTPSGTLGGTRVTDASSTDQLALKLDSSNASALFLWKQTNFLNGLNTGILDLGAGSTVSTTVDTFAIGVAGRAVVKSAGSYYISSAIFSGTGTSSLDLTTLSWSTYDPATSISSIGSSFGLVSGGVIGDVTEIGFFTGVNGGTNAVRLSSVEFNFSPAAVPEPSSYALLAGGVSAFFVLRRKKRSG